MRTSDAILVYCEAADAAWMRKTLHEVGWYSAYGRDNPVRASAIYIARPGSEQAWRSHARNFQILTGARRFSASHIEPFLAQLGRPAQS